MYNFAILIGIYSYLILDLAFLGVLYKNSIYLLTIFYLILIFFNYRRQIKDWIPAFAGMTTRGISKIVKDKLLLILFSLLLVQGLVNLIGALGPELSFDALWYHLTFPKLYLANHSIFHVTGGHLYYSYMPKLVEMIYTAALAFHSEILAKLVHLCFGLLVSMALYIISRKFFTAKISLIIVAIFYSNLVVAWESIAAYIDLGRTFFELLALWGFIEWVSKKKLESLIYSALMLGLAITVKVLSLGSLFIFLPLVLIVDILQKKPLKKLLLHLSIYSLTALFVPLPWFIFSYLNTGNPVYPFFTNTYITEINQNLLSLSQFLQDTWKILLKSDDPISPIYLISLPLIIIFFKKFKFEIKLIGFYSIIAFMSWYFTPRTGGGRFILPYLPAFSILVGAVIKEIWGIKKRGEIWAKLFVSLIIFLSIVSIIYRGVANKKYIPVILGLQTKEDFLIKNLNFSFSDFYDTDGFFKKNIKANEKVLIYGFHNLYYADFSFVDSSFVKSGDKFKYIATQNSVLPERFRNWDLIYSNSKTGVNVYSLGGREWVY